jgi:hypothetical protein
MVLIGRGEEQAAVQLSTFFLPYIRLPKTSRHYIFTLNMATAKYAETLDNFQHSTRLIPGIRSCALNSNREVRSCALNSNREIRSCALNSNREDRSYALNSNREDRSYALNSNREIRSCALNSNREDRSYALNSNRENRRTRLCTFSFSVSFLPLQHFI